MRFEQLQHVRLKVLTRALALAHGGLIEVSSALGKGSVFTVWLPRHDPARCTLNRVAFDKPPPTC